jgi:hypothetical protein
MVIWIMSCSTFSVIEVGTSTSRQINGSVSRNSILTVQIWLKLSTADMSLAGTVPPLLMITLMRPVWQPNRCYYREAVRQAAVAEWSATRCNMFLVKHLRDFHPEIVKPAPWPNLIALDGLTAKRNI